jgi:hypothetical protein
MTLQTDPAALPLKTRVRALFPWREVIVPWLVSRALAAALIAGFGAFTAESVPFGGFAKWDGGWYTVIARHGYGGPPIEGVDSTWPFFPVLPGLMRGLDAIGVGDRLGIMVLNQLLFLVALAGVWRLARRHLAMRPAALGVWALALFPGAFVFSMIYPSSVFLAASVWAFVFVEERHDVSAAGVVAVAAFVRPNGIVVAVALVLALRSWRRVAVVCLPALVLVGIWCALCWRWTDDPFVFYTAKAAWPEVTIVELVRHWPRFAIPHAILGIAAMGAIWVRRRVFPAAYTAFALLYLVPSLVLGMVGLGRYANECFPPFLAVGDILDRVTRRTLALAFTACVGGQALCAWWVIYSNNLP